MKANIITAEEARKKIENNTKVWSDTDEAQLAEVMDMIGKAINIKQREIVCFILLTELVYAEIINLGYKISSKKGSSYTLYIISW